MNERVAGVISGPQTTPNTATVNNSRRINNEIIRRPQPQSRVRRSLPRPPNIVLLPPPTEIENEIENFLEDFKRNGGSPTARKNITNLDTGFKNDGNNSTVNQSTGSRSSVSSIGGSLRHSLEAGVEIVGAKLGFKCAYKTTSSASSNSSSCNNSSSSIPLNNNNNNPRVVNNNLGPATSLRVTSFGYIHSLFSSSASSLEFDEDMSTASEDTTTSGATTATNTSNSSRVPSTSLYFTNSDRQRHISWTEMGIHGILSEDGYNSPGGEDSVSVTSKVSEREMTSRLSEHYRDDVNHSGLAKSDTAEGIEGTPFFREDLYAGLAYVMGESGCPYTALDVAPLLQARYAYISGGKAVDGLPILTFPENPQQTDLSEEDYEKVVTYLCNVPNLFEVDQGFVVIIDRRNNNWTSVRTLLVRISDFFPVTIKTVFILKPSGFFQRAFADYRSKFKDDFQFQVIVCDGSEELFEYIDPSQLTTDVGGDVVYSHNEWIEDRAAIEKFSANASNISKALEKLASRYDDLELPNDVAKTECFIRDHILERKEILEDLTSATHHGGTILACVKGDNPITPVTTMLHVVALERLLLQLDETQKAFDDFWSKHEKRLKQCLLLRQFEDEFRIVQYTLTNHIEWLDGKQKKAGESLSAVEVMLMEFEEFEAQAEQDIRKAERLEKTGDQLISDDHYAVDSIRPKCVEIQRMCEQYKELIRKRNEMLQKSHDLHCRLDRANRWCTRGVDLLATQQLERCQTQHGAEQALSDVENFLATAKELHLSNPKEFRQLFDGLINAETKVLVQQVLKRIEDVQEMFEKRRHSLKRITKSDRPVLPVTPEPLKRSRKSSGKDNNDNIDIGLMQRKTSIVHNKDRMLFQNSIGSDKSQISGDTFLAFNNNSMRERKRSISSENAKPISNVIQRLALLSTRSISLDDSEGRLKKLGRLPQSADCISTQSGELTDRLPSNEFGEIDTGTAIVKQRQRKTSVIHDVATAIPADTERTRRVSGIYAEKSARNRKGSIKVTSAPNITENNNIEIMKDCLVSIVEPENYEAKQHLVMHELIATEKTYVAELYSVLMGYYEEMDNPESLHLLPTSLRGKRDVLFGNMPEIYRFHYNVFLEDLESCQKTPTDIGSCFLRRAEEFRLYSTYCQNKPRSEALRNHGKDDNSFFKECQKRLGHKLPLEAYLLKPVQRITKYQLLLKEMIKYTEYADENESLSKLKEALQEMLKLLKHVNDLMHQVAITGFDGSLSDQGRLLMQGGFNIWTQHKKEKIRDFRLKSRRRHLFLYERSILMCKKKEDKDKENSERASYSFKTLLNMSLVGLTEAVKGDKKKFELWLRGREEVYTIQASSLDTKSMWIKEIKSVLMNQFDKLKVSQLSVLQRSQDDLNRDSICKASEISSDSGYGLGSLRSLVNSGTNRSVSVMESRITDDDPGWSSSEFSNSSEEEVQAESRYGDHIEPSYLQRFISLAEYMPMDPGELAMTDGDIVEVLRVGTQGWWYVHLRSAGESGWVPASYLEPVIMRTRKKSRSVVSIPSLDGATMTGYSPPSSQGEPLDETLV